MQNVRTALASLLRLLLAGALTVSLLPLAFSDYAFAEPIESTSAGNGLDVNDKPQDDQETIPDAGADNDANEPAQGEATEPDGGKTTPDDGPDADDGNASDASDEDFLEADAEAARLMALEALAQSEMPAFTMNFATASTPVVLAPQAASGMSYFFVPAGASLASVSLSFAATPDAEVCIRNQTDSSWEEVAAGAPFDMTDYLTRIAGSEYAFNVGIMSGGQVAKTAEYRLMKGDNLASVFLTSDDPLNHGRPYIESDPYHNNSAAGSIRVLSEDSSERFSGDFSAVKGRGNTSWNAGNKKSYQVKLDKKADLMDAVNHEGATEKSKKWLLIGNPFDPTSMRNELTYQLAKDLGMPAAVDAESVDLYYDGEYRGMYLLTEKVEIGPGRIDIHDLESDIEDANAGVDLDSLPTIASTTSYGAPMQYVAGVNNPWDISGGYLLELDEAFYPKEKSWFATSSGKHFVSKSPEYLSLSQVLYISRLTDEAMTCMENGGIHPTTRKGLSDYFDMDSLVRYFIVQEFCKNADAYISSTFFYVPQGQSKLYAGPVWDCDGTYGLRNEIPEFQSSQDWLARNKFDALTTSGAFMDAIRSCYASGARDRIYNLVYGDANSVGSIDYYSAKNRASKEMNGKIWGLTQNIPLNASYSSYDASLSALKGWAQQRLEWFDVAMGDNVAMHRLYNPNSGEHFYTASGYERNWLVQMGWISEGVGWWAPIESSTPVYRLYSGTDHHYTVSAYERDWLITMGWSYEGVGWYSDDSQRTPLYRQFNPNVNPGARYNNSGSHNYTTSLYEHNYLCSIGWIGEGVGWYAVR